MEKTFFVPPEGPPQGLDLSPEIYEKMGDERIYLMLADFYELLGKSSISNLFKGDLKEASRKSALFFIYILGGPPLYQQQFGHPRMRQRHMAFAIDEEARAVWLKCFSEVLIDAEKKYLFPAEHKQSFWNYLVRFSAWMVNTKV